jgi:hypothetical protein
MSARILAVCGNPVSETSARPWLRFSSRFKPPFWRLQALKRTPETASRLFRAALPGFVFVILVGYKPARFYGASRYLPSISVEQQGESGRQRNLYVGGLPNSYAAFRW